MSHRQGNDESRGGQRTLDRTRLVIPLFSKSSKNANHERKELNENGYCIVTLHPSSGTVSLDTPPAVVFSGTETVIFGIDLFLEKASSFGRSRKEAADLFDDQSPEHRDVTGLSQGQVPAMVETMHVRSYTAFSSTSWIAA